MLKLYTKTGDDGSTGLIGSKRVAKCDPRVTAYGDVDETNAAIGLALTGCGHPDVCDMLRSIQSDLFVLGAELATPNEGVSGLASKASANAQHLIVASDAERLEQWIDLATAEVEPLRHFVLPGGGEEAARFHLARTVCRRAERQVVSLAAKEVVRAEALVYLNRLSDLLFALARLANHRAGVSDIIWPPA